MTTKEQALELKKEAENLKIKIAELIIARDQEMQKISDKYKNEINNLREKKRKAIYQYNLYEARKKYEKKTPPQQKLCYQMFHKRRIDLTPEELRAYNREAQKRWRQRHQLR